MDLTRRPVEKWWFPRSRDTLSSPEGAWNGSRYSAAAHRLLAEDGLDHITLTQYLTFSFD